MLKLGGRLDMISSQMERALIADDDEDVVVFDANEDEQLESEDEGDDSMSDSEQDFDDEMLDE